MEEAAVSSSLSPCIRLSDGTRCGIVKQLSPSPEAVASILGISLDEVRGRMASRGIRRKRWTGTRLILDPVPRTKSAVTQPE
jgi:hypothetical protein